MRFLLWKLHLRFVLNDNPTPLKVPDLYSSDVRSAHSFPAHSIPHFFYYNTIIWSCPNWCDLKSIQLYALGYPFNSVKFYVIIVCHAWLIIEWHYAEIIIVKIPGSGLHGLQAMTIYVHCRKIKHVVQGLEMYGFLSISHPFYTEYKIHLFSWK